MEASAASLTETGERRGEWSMLAVSLASAFGVLFFPAPTTWPASRDTFVGDRIRQRRGAKSMNRPAEVRDKAGRSAHDARLLRTTTTAHS